MSRIIVKNCLENRDFTAIRNDFSQNGFVVVKGVYSEDFLRFLKDTLLQEHDRRQHEGELEADKKATADTGHHLVSFQHHPDIEALQEEVLRVISLIFPGNTWEERDRQIVCRTELNRYPQTFHVDGLGKCIERGLLDVWPTFQLLAGIPLVEVREAGQGGLFVRPGSGKEICELYKSTRATSDHEAGIRAMQKWQESQANAQDGQLLTVCPGDLVLLDSQVAHRADMLTAASRVDCKVYFRFKNRDVVGPQELVKRWY